MSFESLSLATIEDAAHAVAQSGRSYMIRIKRLKEGTLYQMRVYPRGS
jgi:hypothetical protein